MIKHTEGSLAPLATNAAMVKPPRTGPEDCCGAALSTHTRYFPATMLRFEGFTPSRAVNTPNAVSQSSVGTENRDAVLLLSGRREVPGIAVPVVTSVLRSAGTA
jgi:hypothetical protein